MFQPSQGFESLNNPQFNSGQALAMVVMRKKKTLASAGTLSQAGFQQLTAAIDRYWPKSVRQVQNRYAVVPLDGEYRFLSARYAAAHKLLLGLAFPLDTPLVRIRQEMQTFLQVVEALDLNSAGDSAALEQSLQLIRHSSPEPDTPLAAPPALEGWQAENQTGPRHEETSVPDQPTDPPGLKTNDEPVNEPQELSPDSSPSPYWQPLEPSTPDKEDLASIFQEGITSGDDDTSAVDQPWSAAPIKPDPTDADLSVPTFTDSELISLAESVFDTTFYLVPKASDQHLLGELPENLRRWMPKLCERYGWELKLLSIRPDYLKWTLVDFPECLTLKMLAIARKWTSAKIFKKFPCLESDQSSQDFWAPGYLVDTQNRDFPTQVLIANVARERER